MSEAHLRSILKSWVEHYNQGRSHSALGPGVPDPPKEFVVPPKSESRHRMVADALVFVRSILGGLHHEYSLALGPGGCIVGVVITAEHSVRAKLFPELFGGDQFPPNTLLVIDRLVKEDFLIEVEAIASSDRERGMKQS